MLYATWKWPMRSKHAVFFLNLFLHRNYYLTNRKGNDFSCTKQRVCKQCRYYMCREICTILILLTVNFFHFSEGIKNNKQKKYINET
jgi:hypothetical protein